MNKKQKLESVDWSTFRGADLYRPNEVFAALSNLTQLREEAKSQDCYNRVLFAIGNNEAGTLYEAATEAVDFIVDVAETGQSEVARKCAFEILTDMMTFEADQTAPETAKIVRSKILQSRSQSLKKINEGSDQGD